MLPASEAGKLASKIPDARVVILPDAGHLPQRERPEAFASAVAAFITRLGSRRGRTIEGEGS
jgi:3-oxoadipate enol-lactonase